jgi:hypothetical protein
MISLVIKIDDSDNTISNPMLLDNLKMLYPKASINSLPTGYAKFIPTPTPNLGVYEKLDSYTYVKIDDYYTQQYHVVQMTDEEKNIKQDEVKASWAQVGFPSWSFNEQLCCYEPPVINPAQKRYEWHEESQAWVEIE